MGHRSGHFTSFTVGRTKSVHFGLFLEPKLKVLKVAKKLNFHAAYLIATTRY